MSADQLVAILQGTAVLVGALGLGVAQRNKRARVSRRAWRDLERRFLSAMEHIFTLEFELAERGIPRPPRPRTLESSEDDDDDARSDPAP